MEAHHPHHITHKKKWGEYLLEFFMLFLAVFLGSVAENIREHIVEGNREKQFIRSLANDIKADTARPKNHYYSTLLVNNARKTLYILQNEYNLR